MQSEILTGWKDIANYLGKGVRTAQRYERELGLPVRRRARKTTWTVVAVKSELDAWLTSRRSLRSIGLSLKSRMAEMREIANHGKRLILEVRASSKSLRKTARRIHE